MIIPMCFPKHQDVTPAAMVVMHRNAVQEDKQCNGLTAATDADGITRELGVSLITSLLWNLEPLHVGLFVLGSMTALAAVFQSCSRSSVNREASSGEIDALMKFYKKHAVKDKNEADVTNLLQSYDLDQLSNALKAKFGDCPSWPSARQKKQE